MLEAPCIAVPWPYAPSTSLKGFRSNGTSATCDFPSEPLYTRNISGIVGDPPGRSRERSARRGGLPELAQHDRLVDRRRVDLEDLDVVGAVELVVDDAGRLQDAVALLERVLAVALVDERDPAVQHVEHLEVAVVLVQAGRV